MCSGRECNSFSGLQLDALNLLAYEIWNIKAYLSPRMTCYICTLTREMSDV